MIAPEELEQRIERRLADSRFSQSELLLRRAYRMAQDKGNGAAKDADELLRDAGYTIEANELIDLIDNKPWLLEVLIATTRKTPGPSDH
ncbi:hypothetical protein H7Q97_11260 [Ochrobactrum sp. CM-21-5]|nr:hypothetical protein [Ochrobactrum sp. CM-21-5]MBC2885972.1 hypothetical protein [Ochrobactrum sp. CM-21-5]